MLAPLVLAAVAAVLGSGEVVLVDTAGPTVVRRVSLPGPGLALFAAPDGRVLVPLADREATAVVATLGEVSTFAGRLFPLFFDEMDRMHVVLPGAVATLSYPERLELSRTKVQGLAGARRAGCSRDGRLVAVIDASGGGRSLVLVAPGGDGGLSRLELPTPASALAVAPDGGWVAVGFEDGSVRLVGLGSRAAREGISVAGRVDCLAPSPDGRWLLVGAGSAAAGSLVVARVEPGKEPPIRVRAQHATAAPVASVGVAGEVAVALVGSTLRVYPKFGRKEGPALEVQGAKGLSVLPDRTASVIPPWSDR